MKYDVVKITNFQNTAVKSFKKYIVIFIIYIRQKDLKNK